MWFGSLALAGISAVRRLLLEGRDHLGSLRIAAPASACMASICTVLAAFLTAFYSWRLLIMTFHGKPRADQHVMEHVHESPPVMIGPLMVLAIGALVAGMLLHHCVHRRGLAGVLGRQHLQRAEPTMCCGSMEHVPRMGGAAAAAVVGLAASRMAYVMVHVPARAAARAGRRVPPASTGSC